MIATSVKNIEDEKPLLYNCLPSLADHINILFHYYSTKLKLKSFILNIIAIRMIPSMVAAFVLITFNKKLQLDAINLAILTLSIKNCLSATASVYATDCVARMIMDVVPQGAKEEYLDSTLYYAYEAVVYGAANLLEINDAIINYFYSH